MVPLGSDCILLPLLILLRLATPGYCWLFLGATRLPPFILLRVYILRANSRTFRYESATPYLHGVQVVSANALLHNSRIFFVWATFIMKLLGVSLGNEGGGRRGAFLSGGFRIEWVALFSAHPTTKIEPFGAHLVPR